MSHHSLSKEEIVKRVKNYQLYPFVHPLTCGENSRHSILEARIENEEVILYCKDCCYVQRYIPDVVLLGEWEYPEWL